MSEGQSQAPVHRFLRINRSKQTWRKPVLAARKIREFEKSSAEAPWPYVWGAQWMGGLLARRRAF